MTTRQIGFIKRKIGRDMIIIDSSLGFDMDKFVFIVDELLKQELDADRALLGRGRVAIFDVPDVGRIVLRQYLRGGWLRKFVTETFFNSNSYPRPVAELHALQYLHEKGVNVPCPMGVLLRRKFFGLFYKGFIATRLIEGTENLLNLLKSDELNEREKQYLALLAGQEAGKMLKLRVFHPDLHIGNVLVQIGERSEGENTVVNAKAWLIDFDKAIVFARDKIKEYQKKTIARWTRSAEKHGVADTVIYPFEDGT